MSHYTTLETRLVSEKHLVLALKDMGFDEVEVHAEPQPLVGYQGDERAQRAHVIVRRRYLGRDSNDLGFFRNPAGCYELIVSEWDRKKKFLLPASAPNLPPRSTLPLGTVLPPITDAYTYDLAWLGKLTQRYAYHVAMDQLGEQGFSLADEEQDEQGVIHLTLRRMG